ncbi:hypothetical protein ACUN9V_16900 [Salinicola sp. V024]|uniref:hypothetical protein n=1 Tax=Salinicola sp. V024 TaxID=3459609 RepID=UPI004044501B
MAKETLDLFDREKFIESIFPFLNNFLTTSILLALSLFSATRPFHIIATIPAIIFLFLTVCAMILNHWRFIDSIIKNPTPESILPYHKARGPKSLDWFGGFLKALSQERRYTLLGALIFALFQTAMLVNFAMAVINLKTLL